MVRIRTHPVGADAHIGPHAAPPNTAPWDIGPHAAPPNIVPWGVRPLIRIRLGALGLATLCRRDDVGIVPYELVRTAIIICRAGACPRRRCGFAWVQW